MRPQLFILTVLLASGLLVHGQQTVSGVIVADCNVPVPDARVQLVGGNDTVTTSKDGQFELQTGKNPDLRVVVPYRISPRTPTYNRLSLWVMSAMTTRYDVWTFTGKQHPYPGGGIGIGYQLSHSRFLFSLGAEFMAMSYYSNNNVYNSSKSVWEQHDCFVNKGFVQFPFMMGTERQHWYWQVGGKFGFGTSKWEYDGPGDDNHNVTKMTWTGWNHFRMAPTIEFGWNFTPGIQDDVAEERLRPNFKVAVFGEYGFNICDSYSDFMDVALGVKFTVSVQGRAK